MFAPWANITAWACRENRKPALTPRSPSLAWYFAIQRGQRDESHELPEEDPLLAFRPTPSMQAMLKYFWVVMALILVQIGLGVLTAHYGEDSSVLVTKVLPANPPAP